jgi:hypothetical protein
MQTIGTPWEIDVRGSILFFEDVKAPPYYVDGFLTQLAHAGKLQQAVGVVVGEMKDCDWGDQRQASDWARWPHRVDSGRAAASRLGDCGMPVRAPMRPALRPVRNARARTA